jgi:murein DD-endopeptidase MepM/ murein hydrolase activator NlpD
MALQQGWLYTNGKLHRGIDFIQGSLDNSKTWQRFPVVAAFDGQACADTQTSSGGCVSGKGNRVLIRHDLGGGVVLYTYYGHLSWIGPWIPVGNRSNTVRVIQGSQIGVAGDTGTTKGWTHLHFGLAPPSFVWTDSYDLRAKRDKYPTPEGSTSKRAGPNHYWRANPPYFATKLNRNYGSVDFNAYCRSLGHQGASLDGNNAWSWNCVKQDGTHVGIHVGHTCQWQYRDPDVRNALVKDFYNPYSWRCYGPSF